MSERNEVDKGRRKMFGGDGDFEPADDRGDAMTAIKKVMPELSDNHQSELMRNPAALAAVAAFAGIALTSSRPANAQSTGAISAAVSEAVQAVMEPLLETLSETLNEAFGASTDKASDKTTTAIGQAGQATIGTMKDIHDAEVLQSSRPAPASCVTDGASKVVDYGQKRAGSARQKQSAYVAKEMMKGGTGQAGLARDEMQTRERDFPNDEDLVAATLLKSDGYTREESKQAQAFLRRIRGPISVDNITLSDGEKQSPAGVAYQLGRTSVAARSNVGMTAFHDVTARRETSREMARAMNDAVAAENDVTQWDQNRLRELTQGKDGLSLIDVMGYEVDRRYKNPDWRALMADPPSSVPVLREIANMMAFQNHLLFEDFKQSEVTMTVEASNLVSDVEKEAEKLIGTYMNSGGDQ